LVKLTKQAQLVRRSRVSSFLFSVPEICGIGYVLESCKFCTRRSSELSGTCVQNEQQYTNEDHCVWSNEGLHPSLEDFGRLNDWCLTTMIGV